MQVQQTASTRQILIELSYGAALALAVGTFTGAVAMGFVWLITLLNG